MNKAADHELPQVREAVGLLLLAFVLLVVSRWAQARQFAGMIVDNMNADAPKMPRRSARNLGVASGPSMTRAKGAIRMTRASASTPDA